MSDKKEVKAKKAKDNKFGVPIGVQLTHAQIHAMKNKKQKNVEKDE